jgi:ABC-type multidrug transport system ATPase subunit
MARNEAVALAANEISVRVRKSLFRRPVTLLDGISFSMQRGEIVAIIGQSGAGKSKLLEVLSGSSAPQSGSVQVDGLDIHHGGQTPAKVGYVPQDISFTVASRSLKRYCIQRGYKSRWPDVLTLLPECTQRLNR